MTPEEMIQHCKNKMIECRNEARELKKSSHILAWKMWYDRARGQQKAYLDLARLIAMTPEEMMLYCENQMLKWRNEAEKLKKIPNTPNWDVKYERSMGMHNAYFDMARHLHAHII